MNSPSVIRVNGGDDFFYDNQYYPGGSPDAAPAVFEWETDPDCCSAVALLVTLTGLGPTPEYYVFLSGLPGGDYATYDEAPSGYDRPDGYAVANPVSAADVIITDVPESGSTAMLVLCGFGLVCGFLFNARQSPIFVIA